MENKYYVYLHINEDTNTPFYVGKGHGRRAYTKGSRSRWWTSYTSKYKWDVVILDDNLDEKTSFDREVYWIDRIGRKDLGDGPLINMSNGGEGASGRTDMAGQNNPMFGRKFSDEHRSRISKALTGKYTGSSSARYGKTFTDEQKRKMSEAQKGKKLSEKRKKDMSDSRKGEKNARHKNKTNDLPCFVTYSKSSIKPYMVRINNKYIGIYSSIEDAENAIKKIIR